MATLEIAPGRYIPNPAKPGSLIWSGYFLPKQEAYVWTPADGRKKDIALYLGSGKTFASVRKGYLITQLYPGSRGLIGALDYPLVRDTTLGGVHGWFDFMENELELRKGVHFDFDKVEHKLTFPNGSEVLFRGLRDQNKIKSLTLTWAHLEEASDIPFESFNQINGRFRQGAPAGCDGDWRRFLFLSTNPEETAGSIYELFIDQSINPDWDAKKREAFAKLLPSIRAIHAPTTENERLPEDFVDSLIALGDEDWVDVYVLVKTGGKGKGRAYRAFERAVKVDGEIAYYQPELPLRLALDFNVNPMTATISQILNDGRLVTVDEISIKDSDTEELAPPHARGSTSL